jgi:hypothetical protein
VQRAVERGCAKSCGSVLSVCLSEALKGWIPVHLHLAAEAAFLRGADFSEQTIEPTCEVPMARNCQTSAREEVLEVYEGTKETVEAVWLVAC